MSNTEVMKQSAVKLAGKHPKNKIHRTAGDIAFDVFLYILFCLLYTSPSPRD